jgi:hypothetical protein
MLSTDAVTLDSGSTPGLVRVGGSIRFGGRQGGAGFSTGSGVDTGDGQPPLGLTVDISSAS